MKFEEGEYLVSFNDDMMKLIYQIMNDTLNLGEPNSDESYLYNGILAALKTARRIE